MAKEQLILPRADSGCGKVFYSDRKTADGYRIALEFWNRATGHVRTGYQLTVHRCKRCGGFHISQRRIRKPTSKLPISHQSLPTAEQMS
jgi:hypothetical protein